MMRSWTFWRLFATFGLLWLGTLGVLGAVLVARIGRYEQERLEERMLLRAHLVEEALSGRKLSPEDLRRLSGRLGQDTGMRVTLIADDGTVLADSEHDTATLDNHADRPEIRQAREQGFATQERYSTSLGRPMLYAALRAEPGAQPVAFVRVAYDTASVEQEQAAWQRLILTAVGAAALAALALAFVLARRTVRPLRELTEAAAQLAGGEYGHKVYAAGRDELADLARTFNHMSIRLAEQFTRLEQDREQLRAILSGMVEGVVALDAGERILFVNDRASQLLGFQASAAVGRRLWEVVRLRPLQEVVRRALTSGEPCQEELEWAAPSPRSLTVHAARLRPDAATPLSSSPRPGLAGRGAGGERSSSPRPGLAGRGAGGEGASPAKDTPSTPLPRSAGEGRKLGEGASARGAVLVLHDTTELRRLERIRREFVANVSHELKTPLSVIQASVETLLDGAAEDPQPRAAFLERIADQAERLHALILDLLSLARIESGEEAFEWQAVAIAPAVEECLQRHRARADARGQHLLAEPPPAGPDLAAWVDEESLGQILDNLVDNAVKYTHDGSTIRVRWTAHDGQVRLQVEDNGPGIPAADLPRIFERFYRVDKARSREMGGTGLGLSIVKHLVQAMKGTVHATSRLGQGITFTVHLPQAGGP